MTKAKLISYCGICCAIATICIVISAYVKWVAVILAVLASVVIIVPMLISNKYTHYTVLTYLSTAVIATLLSTANIAYCALIITIAMPLCIIKCKCEHRALDSEYTRPNIIKWVLYYVITAIGVGITVGAVYLLTPALLETLLANNILWWAMLLVVVAVPIYDLLLNSCIHLAMQSMRKANIMP